MDECRTARRVTLAACLVLLNDREFGQDIAVLRDECIQARHAMALVGNQDSEESRSHSRNRVRRLDNLKHQRQGEAFAVTLQRLEATMDKRVQAVAQNFIDSADLVDQDTRRVAAFFAQCLEHVAVHGNLAGLCIGC